MISHHLRILLVNITRVIFILCLFIAPATAQQVLYIYGDVDINGWKKGESNYNGTPYHQMRLNNVGQTSNGDNAGTGMSSFKSVVESLPGFAITEVYDQNITLNSTFLNQYDIIILGSNQKTWSNAERDAINVWVRAGGGLLAYSDSGFGGKWSNPAPAGLHNEQGRNSNDKLTEQFGMRFYVDQGAGTGNNVVTSYTIPHPINNNQLNSSASDFIKVEGEGCSPVRIDFNFPGKQSGDQVYQIAKHQFSGTTASVGNDPDLPNGSDANLNCALAAAEIGNGRVVGYFDRNSFWNSGPGTYLHRAGFDHPEFVRNIMTWLENTAIVTPMAITTTYRNPSCHSSSDGIIKVYNSGTYQWSTGATAQSLKGLSAGAYTVTVSDTEGMSASKTVELVAKVQVNTGLSSGTSISLGQDIVLNPSNGTPPYTVVILNITNPSVWYVGDNFTYTPPVQGMYYVRVHGRYCPDNPVWVSVW